MLLAIYDSVRELRDRHTIRDGIYRHGCKTCPSTCPHVYGTHVMLCPAQENRRRLDDDILSSDDILQ